MLCLPRNLHMEVHKVPRLPRHGGSHSAVHATKSAHGGSRSTSPATQSAHRGSQSTSPATEPAHGGSQSAAPATNSAHGGSRSTSPATQSAHGGSQSAVPATKSALQETSDCWSFRAGRRAALPRRPGRPHAGRTRECSRVHSSRPSHCLTSLPLLLRGEKTLITMEGRFHDPRPSRNRRSAELPRRGSEQYGGSQSAVPATNSAHGGSRSIFGREREREREREMSRDKFIYNSSFTPSYCSCTIARCHTMHLGSRP